MEKQPEASQRFDLKSPPKAWDGGRRQNTKPNARLHFFFVFIELLDSTSNIIQDPAKRIFKTRSL